MISDEEYLKLLQNYDFSFAVGKIVQGKVVKIEPNCAFVDIGAKALACCPIKEITLSKEQNIQDVIKENEIYEFLINSSMDEDGGYQLSYKKVLAAKNAKSLEEKFKNNETVEGTVISKVKGGYCVNVSGLKGFVPLSQLSDEIENLNQVLQLKILAFDMSKNNFVLSNKKVYEDIASETFSAIEENMVVKGRVIRITDFGAFIDIGGIEGLLPLSQMSWSWIEKPEDILKLNEKINVEIIGIEKDKQRISLSLKSLVDSPWEKIKNELKEGDIVQGKIVRIKNYGAFVEIKPQIEGLLSNIQINEYSKKNNVVLKQNDLVELKIKKIDYLKTKITFDLL